MNTMRYHALVKIAYLGSESQTVVDGALTAMLWSDLCAANPRLSVTEPAASWSQRNVLTVEATLAGVAPGQLTSPLDAITQLDKALYRSLTRTGLFEEFDVSRRVLRVAPAATDPSAAASATSAAPSGSGSHRCRRTPL